MVCDEGHMLKNEKTALSIAINKISTLRRIILTGTPLQNNLKECKYNNVELLCYVRCNSYLIDHIMYLLNPFLL